MKTTLNSDDYLPLKKMLKLYNMVIVVRSIFHECQKYYLNFFFNESSCKLAKI